MLQLGGRLQLTLQQASAVFGRSTTTVRKMYPDAPKVGGRIMIPIDATAFSLEDRMRIQQDPELQRLCGPYLPALAAPPETEWNAEQQAFIDVPLQHGKLIGIPGGGKTRTILGKIIHMRMTPQSFLVLTFSRAACEDFLTKGQLMQSAVFRPTNVRTIHSFTTSIVKQYVNKTSSLKTVIYRAMREIENRTKDDLLKSDLFRDLRYVVVDEAQDISQLQYDFIMSMCNKLEIPCNMVGDPNQSIYQFQGGSDEFLMNHPGFAITLTKNYRSTPQIVRLVDAAKPVASAPMESAAAEPGPVPTLMYDTIDNICTDILHKLGRLKALDQLGSVAIISSVKKSSRQMNTHALGTTVFTNLLHDHGYEMNVIYREDVLGATDSQTAGKRKLTRNAVNVATIHASKGLEFEHVFLVNFCDRPHNKQIRTLDDQRAFQNLWYVGLSRAKKYLWIYTLKTHGRIWQFYRMYAEHIQIESADPRIGTILDRDLDAPDSQRQFTYSVDQLLKEHVLPDETIAYIEDQLYDHMSEPVELWQPIRGELPEQDNLQSLYKMVAINAFRFSQTGKMPPCYESIRLLNTKSIIVPKAQLARYMQFVRAYHGTVENMMLHEYNWQQLDQFRRQGHRYDIIQFVESFDTRHNRQFEQFMIIPESDLIYMDPHILDGIHLETLSLDNIFRMCIYLFQIKYECKYRMEVNHSEHIEAIRPHYDRIVAYARTLRELPFEYDIQYDMILLPVAGNVHIIDHTNMAIYELTFQRDHDIPTAVKLAWYQDMIYSQRRQFYDAFQLNLRSGSQTQVHRNMACDRWAFYDAVARNTASIRGAIWIYDLETNGANCRSCGAGCRCALNVEECRIMEIHVEEYRTGIVAISTLVLQPYITPDHITGIRIADVLHAPPESQVLVKMREIVDKSPGSIWIAHNGNMFDHRIMQNKEVFDDQVRLGDSMNIIRLICLQPGSNTKRLEEQYQEVLGRPYDGMAHRAANDVEMICRIFRHANIPVNVLLESVHMT